MTSRTRQITVHFSSAFELPDFGRPHAAGDYRVDYDEEQIEDVSRQAWRQVGAFIRLPAITAKSSVRQMVPINSEDLDAALNKDQQQS